MADSINQWRSFIDSYNNTDTPIGQQTVDIPEGDALDGAEDQRTQAEKDLAAYRDAEATVVTKSIITFAPIFKSFIDEAMKSEE